MEDIGKKAHDDEFNKGKEDIGKSPRKLIPVPKVDKKGDRARNLIRKQENLKNINNLR